MTTSKRLLSEAADYLDYHGHSKEPCGYGDDGSVCIILAVERTIDENQFQHNEIQGALDLVRAELKRRDLNTGIISFNDMSSKEEVLDLMRAAAA